MKRIATFALAAALAAGSFVSGRPPVAGAALNPYSHCGTERWHIKTLDDADAPFVHLNPIYLSVQALRAVPAPDDFSKDNDTQRYDPVELQVYRVRAVLAEWKQEADRDYHIVIADPDDASATMVAEVPDPLCSSAQDSGHAADFARVRSAFIACFGQPSPRIRKFPGRMLVDLDGIGFFDIDHGQTGRAKLADSDADIELHPLLRVRTVSGKCSK